MVVITGFLHMPVSEQIARASRHRVVVRQAAGRAYWLHVLCYVGLRLMCKYGNCLIEVMNTALSSDSVFHVLTLCNNNFTKQAVVFKILK